MAKMTNEQKLEAMKEWLRENNVEFSEDIERKGVHIDLWIPKLFIAVHVGDDPESTFYRKTFMWCKPFFIRESETKAFVLEKLQNCCFDQMLFLQRRWQNTQIKKKKQ